MKDVLEYEVYFHYDTDKHSIDPELIFDGIKVCESILQEISSLFDKSIKCEFELGIPGQGSWSAKIKISLVGALGLIGLLSEIVSLADSYHNKGNAYKMVAYLMGNSSNASKKENKEVIELILENTLCKRSKEIESIKGYEEFQSVWIARNNLYKNCKKDEYIQGFGLSKEGNFPVKRKDFDELITIIDDEVELEDLEEVSIEVDSMSLRKGKQWSGVNLETAETLDFYVLDDSFKERVKKNTIMFPAKLRMQVIRVKDTKDVYALYIIKHEDKNFTDITTKNLEEKKQWILKKSKKKPKKEGAKELKKEIKNEEVTQISLFDEGLVVKPNIATAEKD